jgi:hypothetical protein
MGSWPPACPIVICGTTTAIAENAFEKPNAHLIGPGTARTVVGPSCECRSRPTAAIVGRFEKERLSDRHRNDAKRRFFARRLAAI